ncbi:MAG TPA: septicolysin [Chromatiaceae bacterium]|jgi:hypothetical protein|nr:septicolysin [Chromatiaceae bacterium]
MKLAELLATRKSLQESITDLRTRISANAKVQEGDDPDEEIQDLIDQSVRVIQRLEALTVTINKANMEVILPSGETLMEALARRDAIHRRLSLLQHTVAYSQHESSRYSEREIRWLSVMDVADLQKQSDGIAQEAREINLAIQSVNWTTDVPEHPI